MFAAKNELFTRPSGYTISRSVRLRSSASGNLSRTPASASNRKTWTWSAWVKRGAIANDNTMFGSRQVSTSTPYGYLSFDNSTNVISWNGNSGDVLNTTPVYRDPSAWYHIVFVVDTTQATSTNRLKLYVNGQQITTFTTATYPAQNADLAINTAQPHWIGCITNGIGTILQFFDGYLTEINFIDGQALTPSSFGSTNATTGVWQPAKYTGTYGTNGFYLNFSDNSGATATTIGKDSSGNGNNWTPNNISVTAGTTYDSMLDVPTPYADGGNGRGNYAVMNPLTQRWSQPNTAYSDGNLKVSTSSANSAYSLGTIFQSSGKYYWEVTVVATGTTAIGIGVGDVLIQNTTLTNAVQYLSSGNKTVGGSSSAYGSSFTTNDVIGVALDLTGGTVTFYKNNTTQGSISLPSTNDITAFQDINTPANLAINFGQRPFTYTPPSGFVALNTQNLSTPTIANGASYMAATLYTGTGASLTIANTVNSVSFQPDFVWVKGRSGATDHALYDSVRGTTKDLASNTTAAETTQSTGLTAFGSTGFTVGALAKMNTSAATYVGWQWLAGAGTSSSNTSGSITSTVSVNATAGFSVVTYTGNATAGATVGHGLGVAPKLIIAKNRTDGTRGWNVYHASIGATAILILNSSAATNTNVAWWNNTAPSSTVVTLGSDASINGSTNGLVMYCFSAVAGYSAFGSYTGNGSTDGPFVYLGFRPRWVLVKRTDSTSDWYIWDTSRDTYNVEAATLLADTSGAETSATSIDGLSNGFKCRSATVVNASGGTYVYACFAEVPFRSALAR